MTFATTRVRFWPADIAASRVCLNRWGKSPFALPCGGCLVNRSSLGLPDLADGTDWRGTKLSVPHEGNQLGVMRFPFFFLDYPWCAACVQDATRRAREKGAGLSGSPSWLRTWRRMDSRIVRARRAGGSISYSRPGGEQSARSGSSIRRRAWTDFVATTRVFCT